MDVLEDKTKKAHWLYIYLRNFVLMAKIARFWVNF